TMGLISFLKNAGASIFGSSEADKAEEAAKIKEHVEQFGLGIENFTVTVVEDKVTLEGVASSQAEREKVIMAAGNVEGVATVEDLMTVEVPEPEAQWHTVVSGDSLSKIAKTYYDDYMKYPVIFEANKPMLSDPDKIYPGQVLRIPPLSE
ncbi:MAG: peptidoglycan-binding protein LysM, partial [Bacteroidota bacterium]